MRDIMASALIIVSEFAFVLALGFGLVVYKFTSRQRKDHNQAKCFVEKLRKKEPEKNSKRIDTLKEKYHLDDDAIQVYIERLTAREKSVYRKIINIYLGKERETLEQFDDEIDALLESCLVPVDDISKLPSSDKDSVEIEVGSEQVAALTEENTSLKTEKENLLVELDAMKEQSAEMMAEYTMMYGKQGEKERQKVELERDKVKKELEDQDDQPKNTEEENEGNQINENSEQDDHASVTDDAIDDEPVSANDKSD